MGYCEEKWWLVQFREGLHKRRARENPPPNRGPPSKPWGLGGDAEVLRVNFKNNHHVSRICKNSQNPVSNFKNSHIANLKSREFNETKKLNKSLKLMYYPLVSPNILLRRPLARPLRMSDYTAQSALLNLPDGTFLKPPPFLFSLCSLLSWSAWLTPNSCG